MFNIFKQPRSESIRAADQGRPLEELRRAAVTYLNGDLKARLNLTNIEMFAGNYQNATAESAGEKLLVKFYPDYAAYKIHRSVLSYSLIGRHGLKAPGLIYADTSQEGLEKHGLSCVVTRWVTGTPLVFGDQAATDRAFRLLARMHRITIDDLDVATREKFGQSLRQVDCAPEIGDLRYAIRVLQQVSDAVTPEEAVTVEEFLSSQLDRATVLKQPRVLLHMDYQPGNLILTPDGEIAMIDFEGSTFGGFYVDLTRALFKFGFKTKSKELDKLDIEELIHSERFNSFMDSYCAEAPSEARDFWTEHRGTVVIWGYLKTLRSLAQKAMRYGGSGGLKGRRATKQLRHRWEKVVRYVEKAAQT